MKKIIFALVAWAGIVVVGCAPNNEGNKQAVNNARYYADKGMQYAAYFPGLVSLCDIESPIRDLSVSKKRVASTNKPQQRKARAATIQPTKVLDNLYFVGTRGVSSWVLETTEGLILIDALSTNHQAAQYIEKGMLSLGLDPADTKYLIIAHEHGDHYGGQGYFVNKYQTRVIMGDTAWTRLEQDQLKVFSPRWGNKPTRDITVTDNEAVHLGDTEVKVYETPGHTPGTISLIFPVFDQGKRHTVALWGGTGLNYGPDKPRIQAYSDAAMRFAKIARQHGVDIFLSNHPPRDGTGEKIQRLAERLPGESHPFVLGLETAPLAFDMLADCTQAQAMRIGQ